MYAFINGNIKFFTSFHQIKWQYNYLFVLLLYAFPIMCLQILHYDRAYLFFFFVKLMTTLILEKYLRILPM